MADALASGASPGNRVEVQVLSSAPFRNALGPVLVLLALVSPAAAQRTLHWDRIDVVAHLDADGDLLVTETQDIVFTGDWNGGERRFDVRPGQRLRLLGLARLESDRRIALKPDGAIDDVDEYVWAADDTLRWRSRRLTDPPFSDTRLRYELSYRLSGVLRQDGDGSRLRHDFAFSDRDGVIARVTVRLTFDPVWAPPRDLPAAHQARALAPGRGFVLTVPLRYTGAKPLPIRPLHSPVIVRGVVGLLGLSALAVAWFFVREHRLGRFASPPDLIDEPWLREHVLRYPAEVVGAAWDDIVDKNEVAALIARLVSEGTLESGMEGGNPASGSLRLRLKVDRASLSGYERTLVDGLFFDGRDETSPALVRDRYKGEGFNPASRIRDDLRARVDALLPKGDAPRSYGWLTALLLLGGLALVWLAWLTGGASIEWMFVWAVCGVVLGIAGGTAGAAFRTQVDWGRRQALLCLLPAFLVAGGASAWLWFYGDAGAAPLSSLTVLALVAMAWALTHTLINALKTRQSPEALAFRKRLNAARAFFETELENPHPSLRHEWYPWLLALGLGPQAEAWSADAAFNRAPTTRRRRDRIDDREWPASHEPEPASTPSTTWAGFGGGRSGGAGGGASWGLAAGAFSVGVPARSSRSDAGSSSGSSWDSSDSSSSSTHSSSDSGSSTSGGGGGGGW
jgi:hypothetical protein